MNGGAYNVLINTSSKPVASFAACLAVISYIATGVVSAATAVSYLQVHCASYHIDELVWRILKGAEELNVDTAIWMLFV